MTTPLTNWWRGQRLLADWATSAPRIAAGSAFWAMLTFFLLRDRVMLARWGMSLVATPILIVWMAFVRRLNAAAHPTEGYFP